MTQKIKDLSDSNTHCPLPAPKKGSYFQSTKDEHSFYFALLKQRMRQIFQGCHHGIWVTSGRNKVLFQAYHENCHSILKTQKTNSAVSKHNDSHFILGQTALLKKKDKGVCKKRPHMRVKTKPAHTQYYWQNDRINKLNLLKLSIQGFYLSSGHKSHLKT